MERNLLIALKKILKKKKETSIKKVYCSGGFNGAADEQLPLEPLLGRPH